MKYLVKKTGQYQSSNGSFKFNKRKDVLNFLRIEAHRMRRESRILMGKKFDNVDSLPRHFHKSELVTMASFNLEKLGMEQLLKLINNHGVIKYEVIEL